MRGGEGVAREVSDLILAAQGLLDKILKTNFEYVELFNDKVSITDKITLGGDRMVLFAGPCAAESYDICMETGTQVKENL
jgi:3-deoxy-D-arabino-heptulosonate 7-phosphate (DAHP) synthase